MVVGAWYYSRLRVLSAVVPLAASGSVVERFYVYLSPCFLFSLKSFCTTSSAIQLLLLEVCPGVTSVATILAPETGRQACMQAGAIATAQRHAGLQKKASGLRLVQ